MKMEFLMLLAALAAPALAAETAPLRAGDCVVFREGGGGRLLKEPTYWLRGTVAEVRPEKRRVERCPDPGKPVERYIQDDWARIAAVFPCGSAREGQEVDVLRVLFRVAEWETPWALNHGRIGWLYRGRFLDRKLKKDELIDMDASWLQACEDSS